MKNIRQQIIELIEQGGHTVVISIYLHYRPKSNKYSVVTVESMGYPCRNILRYVYDPSTQILTYRGKVLPNLLEEHVDKPHLAKMVRVVQNG